MNKPRKKTCSKDPYDTVFHASILVLLAFLLALGKSPAQDPLISTAAHSFKGAQAPEVFQSGLTGFPPTLGV